LVALEAIDLLDIVPRALEHRVGVFVAGAGLRPRVVVGIWGVLVEAICDGLLERFQTLDDAPQFGLSRAAMKSALLPPRSGFAGS
jgi:hypothetical protein